MTDGNAGAGGVMGGEGQETARKFAELVAARLCHDMSGPLSVIANAAELARLEAERGVRNGGEAMALMLEGGRDIAARVRFLRRLFGPAMGPISGPELLALARAAIASERIVIDAEGFTEATSFGAEAGRAWLAACVVAAEALPRGGTITCHGGTGDFALAISGAAAAWPPHLTAVLGGAEPVAAAIAGGARGLMGPFLAIAAAEAGLAPRLLMGAGVPLLRLAAR